MTTLAPLSQWEATAHSLHKAAQIPGAIRLLVLDPVPNYLEWSLVIRPEGLSTGPLPFGGEVLLDFAQCAMLYRPATGEPSAVSLLGQSQASVLEALLATMESQGQMLAAPANGRMPRTDALLAALEARGHVFTPKRADLADEAPLEIDPRLSADYSRVLYQIFTATARFRARLNGPMTAIVVWPEHFDLSFLWFASVQAIDRFPHMNFGFAPFSDDILRPYLYAYAYPMPDGFERLRLPPLARRHTEGWKGVVVPYDDLVRQSDPDTVIEDIFMAIYTLLSPSLVEQTLEKVR
jgi:hypothetical protein